jgi:hypothetical protein
LLGIINKPPVVNAFLPRQPTPLNPVNGSQRLSEKYGLSFMESFKVNFGEWLVAILSKKWIQIPTKKILHPS